MLSVLCKALGQLMDPSAQNVAAVTFGRYVTTSEHNLLADHTHRTLTTIMQGIFTTILQEVEENIIAVPGAHQPLCIKHTPCPFTLQTWMTLRKVNRLHARCKKDI